MWLGIADHLGCAVAITATADHDVVDRRRIELVESGRPVAPIHHHGGAWSVHATGPVPDDHALEALVADVRASVVRCASAAFAAIQEHLDEPIVSISLRRWDPDFPQDIATMRRVPYESRADATMYRQVMSDVALRRGWRVHHYDAASVENDAAAALGGRAREVLHGPRSRLGPPWSKDHRVALAATVLAR